MTKAVYIIVILYIFLSGFHAYFQYWENSSITKAFFYLIVDLALPLVGFFFLWFCDVLAIRQQKNNYSDYYENIYYEVDELNYLQMPDTETEINQVSMNEALRFNSYEYRRNMIMQILSEEDALQYLDVLQNALSNDDSETSHYASTIIMELQRKTQDDLSNKKFLFKKNPNDMSTAQEYEEMLYRVLKSSLYDEHNTKRLYTDYVEVADAILSNEEVDEKYYINYLEILFDLNDFTSAEEICSRFSEIYPNSENVILYKIKLFILSKNGDGMRKLINSLSDMPVVLTQKTLGYVRMFREVQE